MKRFNKYIVLFIVFSILGLLIYDFYSGENFDIEKILTTKNYSFLNNAAKDLIRNYYNETGEVLLTEKNKEDGEYYLNPDYVEYLEGSSSSSTGYVPEVLTSDVISIPSLKTTSLPNKYDSRNVNGNNYITPLKRQYSELCWDYAFTSAIESKLLIDGFNNDVNSLDLSERMMDYASSDPISVIDTEKNPYYANYYLNSLADSGNYMRYSSLLINGLFPINESDWHYDQEYMGKVKPEDVYDLSKTNYQVNEVLFLKDNNHNVGFDTTSNDLFKNYIMGNGSIVLALRVGAGHNYVSYDVTQEEQLNPDNNKNTLYYKDISAKYQSNDHMVAIIGWDDEYTHNVCIKDGGELSDASYNNGVYSCSIGTLKNINGAWIIKDSSSKEYRYVAYETVNSEYFVIKNISYKDWDNVYSSSNNEAYTRVGNTYTFNKLSNSEVLKSIKFYSNSAYDDLKIYINTYDGEGEQLLTNYSYEVGGMYTIPISNQIQLNTDKFSIRFNNPISNFSVFTSNFDNNKDITIGDSEVVNSFNYQSLLNEYQNVIVIKGSSRNISKSINIDYIIKDSNNNDVTSLFNIIRDYSVSNYINTLIRFNNTVPFGEYTAYAYINNTLLSTFNININKYMENISGSGTQEDPYIIINPTELDMIRLNKYNFYKLGNDIDLTYDTKNENGLFYNDGKGFEPISYSTCSVNNNSVYCSDGFSGGFDGNNKKIIGLYINRPNEDVIGLFKNTYNTNYSGLNFKNIILKDVDITGKNYVGGLLGYAYGTTHERTLIIENISVSGSINGNNYVGGLIGFYNAGTGLDNYLVNDTLCVRRHCLSNLFNSSSVSGNNYVGGLFGLLATYTTYDMDNYKWRSTIEANNIQNNGTITSNNSASGFAGYVLLRNGNSITLNNSINTGIVEGLSNTGIINDIECTNTDEKYPTCSLSLNNIYYTNDSGYNDSELITANNVRKYSVVDLTNDNIYNSFVDFTTYYKKETINNIKRIPFVKNAYVEYTDAHDITINDNENASIYDYIDGSNNITYSISDESIATINQNGIISPLKSGNTTIHITSNYDGYDNDINLSIGQSVIEYTINYNLDGGSATNPTVYTNNSNSFTLNNPTKEGYEFIGWTGSNGNTPQLVVTIEKGTTGNLSFTANYRIIELTVTFNSNGGSNISEIKVNYDSTISKPTDPVRNGYTFKGWLLNNLLFNFNTKIRSNITLVASWEILLSEELSNNNYTVDNNYVTGFNLGDSIESIRNSLNDESITITCPNSIISTGTIITKGNQSYTVVIKGDLDGDGIINQTDLLQMRQYLLDDISLTGAYKKAGIIESNGEIKSLDLLRLKQYLLGEYNF